MVFERERERERNASTVDGKPSQWFIVDNWIDKFMSENLAYPICGSFERVGFFDTLCSFIPSSSHSSNLSNNLVNGKMRSRAPRALGNAIFVCKDIIFLLHHLLP